MDRSIDGVGSAEYLWSRKQVIAILKVDKGLAGFLFDQVCEVVRRQIRRRGRIGELDALRQVFAHMAHHPRQRIAPAGALRLFRRHSQQRTFMPPAHRAQQQQQIPADQARSVEPYSLTPYCRGVVF